jgi:Ca2+-binding EF-hand superfamily protein/TolB-like protein
MMRNISVLVILLSLVFFSGCAARRAIKPEERMPVASDFQAWADANHNGQLEAPEIEELARAMRILLKEPHGVQSPMDEFFDWNRDGFIDPDELERIRFQLFERQVPKLYRLKPRLARILDQNNDKRLDPGEVHFLLDFFFFNPNFRRPHKISNPIDEKIDKNKNGFIEEGEIEELEGALYRNIALLPLDISPPKEPLEKRPAGERGPEGEGFPVVTIIDEHLDLNGDRIVDKQELREVLMIARQEEHQIDQHNKIEHLFDLNRDGFLSADELFHGRELFFRPHPVDPHFQMDLELDNNRDGFIDPQEIGIAAGYSPVGDLEPFDELLERPDRGESERTEKPEQRKNLKALEGKKIAVVGLNITGKTVDQETAEGLILFIENAFVNVGTVKVVDRQNITSIISEHEFQQSDLTDEKTAVQIGKLSGADIIVIGSISYVGGKYYLNIKLINADTAEISGSSIAEASESSEFYNMCNEAVNKLF